MNNSYLYSKSGIRAEIFISWLSGVTDNWPFAALVMAFNVASGMVLWIRFNWTTLLLAYQRPSEDLVVEEMDSSSNWSERLESWTLRYWCLWFRLWKSICCSCDCDDGLLFVVVLVSVLSSSTEWTAPYWICMVCRFWYRLLALAAIVFCVSFGDFAARDRFLNNSKRNCGFFSRRWRFSLVRFIFSILSILFIRDWAVRSCVMDHSFMISSSLDLALSRIWLLVARSFGGWSGNESTSDVVELGGEVSLFLLAMDLCLLLPREYLSLLLPRLAIEESRELPWLCKRGVFRCICGRRNRPSVNDISSLLSGRTLFWSWEVSRGRYPSLKSVELMISWTFSSDSCELG